VISALIEKALAKINLTLRVLGRRADGFHELESLVAFTELADTLTLAPGAGPSLDITGPFAAACGAVADNLVLKAVAALRERVSGLQSGRFFLEKRIPVAGGLGGGSADAAATLRLLARANGLAPDDPRLGAAALAVGADVPVCLDPRARIMRGIGELLSAPLAIASLPAVLVNPRVPLVTREVFGAFAGTKGGKVALTTPPRERDPMFDFLARYDNDLTNAAIAHVPALADLLAVLRALPGVRLARMSGSGPTCFALFGAPGEASAAARRLQDERKDWWVASTVIA
jgi:4-diphosphocytidyl-2-C-methyl-D-erythritol kinase